MSDILCKWLNEELRLSQAVDPKTFAKNFSTGYLIGEVLHKYQLQNDFSMFMMKDTSISRVNNFTRLEPTLRLLGISFNINTAKELMQEKHGVAEHLLYQLYVSLEKKRKAQISGTLMEILQPAASAGLRKKEHEIYSDQLHRMVKRDAELKLQKISQHYEEKCQQWKEKSVMIHPIQQKRQPKVQSIRRIKKIEEAAIVRVPKPPPYNSQVNLKRRQRQLQCRAQQAQTVQMEIAQFETNRKKLVPCGFASFSSGQSLPGDFPLAGGSLSCSMPESGTKLILQSSSKYIQDIRQRLEENAVACERRKKRIDRFLVEQLKAHDAQEEERREEQLVKRLTRQTQQEQCLASQLLQMRVQKEVFRQNRLFREQQYQQRRERDFQEALEREAALAQQAKLEHEEEIRQELEIYSRISEERSQSRYKKHFASCKDIVEQIVDLAAKVGEYRLLTENLIPEKMMREWKELLLNGLPLYEPREEQHQGFEFSTPLDPVELRKQEILKNQGYDEYTNMEGEWTWPEEAGETKLPLTNNNILGHVVVRLRNTVHPPIMELPSSTLLDFTLKACVLGKFCSGKTTCLTKIAQAHGIYVLSADTLIEEALHAYQNGEKKLQAAEQQEEKDSEQLLTSSTSLQSDLDPQEESRDDNLLSTRAMLGVAAEKELRKGNTIPNELVADIIVEAIKQVPAKSGWILDGFPVDIAQAHLLEKALGGSIDDGNAVVSSRTNLAADPNPPEPQPPPAPILDLALLLEIPDECVFRRALSHTGDTDTAAAAAAAATTSHHIDKNLYLAQSSLRLTAFNDAWPRLEKWFGEKQNILVHVDADIDEEKLFKRVESVLQQVMRHTEEAPATPPVEDVDLDNGKALDFSSSTTPPPVDKPAGFTKEAPGPTQSHSSLNEEKAQSVKSLSKASTQSPREHSRRASTSSVINENSQGVLDNLPESASPYPGSPNWVYVDEPLPSEIPECLCSHWDTMCDSYVSDIKAVTQQLCSQRNVIIHHLHNNREEYKHYLCRPDLKQELVSQWQKDFNSISDDVREDEDTKAELHLRLDELCERLWDISDKRKEEDEQKKATLMGEGWLEDHTAVLINHHLILIKVEMDRFQATLYFLRVYYLSMCNQVLPELPSNLFCISMLDSSELKDPDKSSTEPAVTSSEDGESKRKTKLRPDSKTKGQDETEPGKPSHEKLISSYKEALTTINKMVSAEAHQGEKKEQKESTQEKEKVNNSASSKKKEKGKQASKKKKGPPSPPSAPSPAPTDDKSSDISHDEEVKNKIFQEYAAALAHEGDAAKARIALVKGHGLVMVHFLQSRAEQTSCSMQKGLETHYLAEMKSIDQLSKVVRHHIDAGAKLQNELVLERTDFYLNGDLRMVASPPPPPRPPTSEKPIQSTPTIAQLESLHKQLLTIAPSGLMSSLEFLSLLRDITSVNIGRNILPEPWIGKNETQLMEIVSLLTDDSELIDWRRFLLSAAFPWPVPSLMQLLMVLQRFKAADNGTGYINEEQYLQTELWFSNESDQPIPEDPSEPLPFDRLSNLGKFFFQLFADHSFSPPRLDYVSMLQYFAADPNPGQGFIRALSVVLGQHLKHSLPGHLVKSMPCMEEATELSSSELDAEHKGDETRSALSGSLGEREVSIPALLAVICHKVAKMNNDNPLPPGCLSQEEHTEHLVHIFRELGYKPEECVPFSILSKHPFTQNLMETSTQYQLVNIHQVLQVHQDEGETTETA